jgi:G-protein signaling modulator 2
VSQGEHLDDEESFFDLLSRFQSKRMDDQRCSLTITENKENTNSMPKSNHNNNATASIKPMMPLINNNAANSKTPSNAMQDDLLDLIAGMQSKRMDEQRVALPHLPGLNLPHSHKCCRDCPLQAWVVTGALLRTIHS